MVKCSTLRWFGYLEGMGGDEIQRIYKSEIDAVGARGRSHIKWADRVLEYLMEREMRD